MKAKAWIVISAVSLLVFFSAPQPLIAQYLSAIATEENLQATDLKNFLDQQVLKQEQPISQMQRWQIVTGLQTKINLTQQQLQAQKQQGQTYKKWDQYIRPGAAGPQPQKTQKDALLANPTQGQSLNRQSLSPPGKVQAASRQNQLSLYRQPSMANQAYMARQAPTANRASVPNRASMANQAPRTNQAPVANRASVVNRVPSPRQTRR
jgi:hypothetical protein